MISIIICSVNSRLLTQLKINIEETIGMDFQLIAVDNAQAAKGICEVYNTAARKASYPIVCFCHEDVIFLTNNWGKIVVDHFEADKNIGLIGVAGGDTKGIVPSGWFTTYDTKYMNLKQGSAGGNTEHMREGISDLNGGESNRKKALTIDGVLMFTKREIIREFQFDEHLLKGFHGYDTDYSLLISRRFKVMVIYDLLIHHFSEGKLNRDWFQSTRLVTAKWKNELPKSVRNLTSAEFSAFHWKSLQVFLEHALKLGISRGEIWGYYFRYALSRYFSFRRSASMAKFLVNGLRSRDSVNDPKTVQAFQSSNQQ